MNEILEQTWDASLFRKLIKHEKTTKNEIKKLMDGDYVADDLIKLTHKVKRQEELIKELWKWNVKFNDMFIEAKQLEDMHLVKCMVDLNREMAAGGEQWLIEWSKEHKND